MSSTTTAVSDNRKGNSKNAQPLPLPSVLRDLAVLRASDIDLSSLVPGENTTEGATPGPNALDDSVEKSRGFIQEARKAIKIQDREDVINEGDKVEQIRQELEEVDQGLQASQ